MNEQAVEKIKDSALADWERIEISYRAGILSLRDIAKEDGHVSEGAIRKRAKRDHWTRDLGTRIQQKAADLVRSEIAKEAREIREPGTLVSPVKAQEVVELNAEVQAEVKRSQRERVTATRLIFNALMEEQRAYCTQEGRDYVNNLCELVTGEMEDEGPRGQSRADRMREGLQRAMSHSTRVDNAKKLIEILEKLIKLENEVYGIVEDKAAGGIDGYLKSLPSLEQLMVQQ